MNSENSQPEKMPAVWLNVLCFCLPWMTIATHFFTLDLESLGLSRKNPLAQIIEFLQEPLALLIQLAVIAIVPLIILGRGGASLRTSVAARWALNGCGINALALVGVVVFIATTFKGCC